MKMCELGLPHDNKLLFKKKVLYTPIEIETCIRFYDVIEMV